ncbi:MAG: hypothetical protein HY308_01175 [Gammaproteobacteria bacterium]|nr:hypothetical protein [Gammaproteobacteria bacterium]
MNEQQLKQQFHELLPWYVNGTLATADREWMDQYIKDHPDVRSELRWDEFLRQAVQQVDTSAVSADVGMEKFLSRIRQEQRSATPRFSERLRAWRRRAGDAFAGDWSVSMLTTGLIVVVVIQAVINGVLVLRQNNSDYGAVRSVGGVARGPLLEVNFRADASEHEIRFLLVELGASVVGGPGQLGNYLLHVPSDKVDESAQRLAASKIVLAVRILPPLPAGE